MAGKGGKTPGAGRKLGTPNKLTQEYKAIIAESNPIQFLVDAFTKGKILDSKGKQQGEDLTAKERVDIANNLARKIMPDLKAVEHTGEGGSPFTITVNKAPIVEEK
jgi:hypothetical protein